MCRLLAYVHAGSPRSMGEALGPKLLEEFLSLAEVHRDGWGLARRSGDSLSAYLSTRRASHDGAVFRALTAEPLVSAVIHERWASPGIGLSLDNQQPFVSRGLAFAHNGTIGNAEGNIVDRPAGYRKGLGLERSTTRSDSRIYAELFFLKLAEVLGDRGDAEPRPDADQVREALVRSLSLLRRDYPEAGFNALIQSPDFTFAARAHAKDPVCSETLRRRYEEVGWARRIPSYYELAYTSFEGPEGSRTSVVSSSGYAASDPWPKLPNNSLLAISHVDASTRILDLV